MKVIFSKGALTAEEGSVVSDGFRSHARELGAPEYRKETVKWIGRDDAGEVDAVLCAEILWDWIYIDELWVRPGSRGRGYGTKLMGALEEFAGTQGAQGIWLWTQSWQAPGFYSGLGYEEFTRFDGFPVGNSRIGFRKFLRKGMGGTDGG